jgi:hypothetical protein
MASTNGPYLPTVAILSKRRARAKVRIPCGYFAQFTIAASSVTSGEVLDTSQLQEGRLTAGRVASTLLITGIEPQGKDLTPYTGEGKCEVRPRPLIA